MHSKNNIVSHISRTFSLPEDTILDAPVIKIISNKELTIENHRGILEYTPSLIRLDSKIAVIKILGRQIRIKVIDQYEIVIIGEIYSLEYIQ